MEYVKSHTGCTPPTPPSSPCVTPRHTFSLSLFSCYSHKNVSAKVVWTFQLRNYLICDGGRSFLLSVCRATTSHRAGRLPSVNLVAEPRREHTRTYAHTHAHSLSEPVFPFTVSGCEEPAVRCRLTDALHCLRSVLQTKTVRINITNRAENRQRGTKKKEELYEKKCCK